MMTKFFGFNLDFAGAATATLCALHCAAFPILLSLGLITSTHHNHIFDWVLMSIGILIAGIILSKDYFSGHKNVIPLILAGIGFFTLFIGIESHGQYTYLNVMGGLTIVVSHLFNWRLSHAK